jgi:hypothetical protein
MILWDVLLQTAPMQLSNLKGAVQLMQHAAFVGVRVLAIEANGVAERKTADGKFWRQKELGHRFDVAL